MPLTLVQGSALGAWGKTNNGAAPSGSVAVSWSQARTAGNVLFLAANSNNTIVDPTGWTKAKNLTAASSIYIWYRIADNTSTDTPTISNGAATCIAWAEYSGNSATPLDATSSNGTSVEASTAWSTGTTGTTAQADELAIAAWGGSHNGTIGTWSGETNSFSQQAGGAGTNNGSVNVNLDVSTLALAATQTIESTATPSLSCARNALMVTFKAAAAAPPAAPPSLLKDTFTDTDNTALTAHTMDVGPGWVAVNGTFKILANQATPNSAADNDIVVVEAGVSDLTLSIDVVPQTGANWQSDPDIVVRYSDPTHLWVIHVLANTHGFTTLYLFQNAGSGYVSQATANPNIDSGTPYTIKVVLLGPLIQVYLNGVLQINFPSATGNQTATKVGLRYGTAGVVVTQCTWDNLNAPIIQTPTSYAPEIRSGPPMQVAPWFKTYPQQYPVVAPVAPLPAQATVQEVHTGPPMRNSPWNFVRPLELSSTISIPPPPARPKAAGLPLIRRQPDVTKNADGLARFSEMLSMVFNSLVRQGILVQTSASEWSLVVGTSTPLVPSPAGKFTLATVTVDQFGRVVLASSGSVIGLTDGNKGDITSTGAGTSWTINAGVVTYAKIQPVTQDRLLGRQSPGSGTVEEIPLTGMGRQLTGAVDIFAARNALGLGDYVTVFNNANQLFNSSTPTVIQFNSTREDTAGYHSVTNPARLVVPAGKAGIYVVWMTIRWDANPIGARQQVLLLQRHTGAAATISVLTENANSISFADYFLATVVRLQDGDYIFAIGNQTTGAPLNVVFVPEYATNLGMFRIST